MRKTLNKVIKDIIPDFKFKLDYHDYEGFLIQFEDCTELFLGIDMNSSCCEQYNYLTTHDDLSSFIGEKVKTITFLEDPNSVQGKMKAKKTAKDLIKKDYDYYNEDELGYMFVNVQTNKDMFQLVVYNYHNGYYSHSAIFTLDGNITENRL